MIVRRGEGIHYDRIPAKPLIPNPSPKGEGGRKIQSLSRSLGLTTRASQWPG